MRRRQPPAPPPGVLPDRVRRFRVGEWPGASEDRQCAAWREAVDVWCADHPEHEDLIECPDDTAIDWTTI